MEDRIRNVFAAVFQMPTDAVSTAYTKDTLSQWDSLKHITLILALENEFGVRFEDAEYGQLDSFAAILSVLQTKLP